MFLPSFVSFGIFHRDLCVSNKPSGRKKTQPFLTIVMHIGGIDFSPCELSLRPWGEGVRLEILGEGEQPGSQNPDPISDQKT